MKTFPLSINDELYQKVQLLIYQYYTINKKNSIMKKTQKVDCCKYVCDNVCSNNLLINKTIFIDRNRIYINYPFFKLYAYSNIFNEIVDNMMTAIYRSIMEYRKYEIHINIEGFTISACERYAQFINLVFSTLSECKYSDYLEKIYVYNCPSVIDYFKHTFSNIAKNISGIDEKIVIVK